MSEEINDHLEVSDMEKAEKIEKDKSKIDFSKIIELEKSKQEEMSKKIRENTLRICYPLWINNFEYNLKYTLKAKTLRDIIIPTKKNKSTIVVAAGPSFKDKIEELKNFDGIIICVNKALIPLLEKGIVPDFVVAVDALPVVFDSFNNEIVMKYSRKIKCLLADTIHKNVSDFVTQWFKEVYWFNETIGDDLMPNASKIMKDITGLQSMSVGGNVGGTAFGLAYFMGCNPIGLLGFDLSSKCTPKMSLNESKVFGIYYNPIIDETFYLTPPFEEYKKAILSFIERCKSENTKVINLTPCGTLYYEDVVPFMTVNEFCEARA